MINHKLYPSANHSTTEMLIEKIKRGEFLPEPPLIYSFGNRSTQLVDGHHRMAAIFHSGQTVQIGIKFMTYDEYIKQEEAKK